jgi:arylsulfatase A-like enzyme
MCAAVAGGDRVELSQAQPNVLLIAVDDLNDWVGCLHGHPQARTPHIDRLAEAGVLFTNAHCQAPLCTASRASLLTSRHPWSTGLYFLRPALRDAPTLAEAVTFAEHFAAAGYRTLGAGKIYHDREASYFQEYAGRMGGFGPFPPEPLHYDVPGAVKLWDWGAFPESDSQMPDAELARWAAAELQREQPAPFLLAIGFGRPHVPMYAPPRWFEQHPLEAIELPRVRDGDRADLPRYARRLTAGKLPPSHRWMVAHDQWKRAVQSYLACVSFVDHQVGRVVSALRSGPHASNTVVILFSDHGWHLGEKQHWAKRTLWSESTRVPLIIAGPGIEGGRRCARPVGLIDLLPTTSELAGLEPRASWQGRSLVPLLRDPLAAWDRPVVTTYAPGNHAVCDDRWRYIRYHDGSEELYDRNADPEEWYNLIGREDLRGVVARLSRALPGDEHPPLLAPGALGVDAWRRAEALVEPSE